MIDNSLVCDDTEPTRLDWTKKHTHSLAHSSTTKYTPFVIFQGKRVSPRGRGSPSQALRCASIVEHWVLLILRPFQRFLLQYAHPRRFPFCKSKKILSTKRLVVHRNTTFILMRNHLTTKFWWALLRKCVSISITLSTWQNPSQFQGIPKEITIKTVPSTKLNKNSPLPRHRPAPRAPHKSSFPHSTNADASSETRPPPKLSPPNPG